jgi:hypothetical protein
MMRSRFMCGRRHNSGLERTHIDAWPMLACREPDARALALAQATLALGATLRFLLSAIVAACVLGAALAAVAAQQALFRGTGDAVRV